MAGTQKDFELEVAWMNWLRLPSYTILSQRSFKHKHSPSPFSSIAGDMADIGLRNGFRRAVVCLKRPSPQYTSHIPRRRPIIPQSPHQLPNIARQFTISCPRSAIPTLPKEPNEPNFQAAPPLDESYFKPSIEALEKSIYDYYSSLEFSPEEAAEASKTALARRLDSFKASYHNSLQNGLSPEQAQLRAQQEIDEITTNTAIDHAAQIMMDALMEKGISYEDALEMVNEMVNEELEEGVDEATEDEIQDEEEAEEGEEGNDKRKGLMARIRIVPASPSYFTGKPNFTDDLISLKALLRKYQVLPVFPPGQAPRVAWKSVEQYKAMVGAEPVKSARYHRLLEILKRLNSINSAIMPEEVSDTLARYKRNVDLSQSRKKQGYVNADGISLGVGRRKTSTARAYVVEGEGEVLVNGKSLTQFFARLHDRASAVWALKATERVDKYNVFALVKGGGATGQAEALTLAVAKALLVHEPLLKPALRRGMSSSAFLAIQCTTNPHYSWLRNPRSPKGRKKEARPSQGSQEACLGQALIFQRLCVSIYVLCTPSNHTIFGIYLPTPALTKTNLSLFSPLDSMRWLKT